MFSAIISWGFLNGIKTDLISHRYPQMEPIIEEEGVRMVSMREIGAMKLNAILGNGTRLKDFIDMYFLLEHYCLDQLVETYVHKYPDVNHTMVVNALTYFDDIDHDMPIQFTGTVIPFKTIGKRLNEAAMYPQQVFSKHASLVNKAKKKRVEDCKIKQPHF